MWWHGTEHARGWGCVLLNTSSSEQPTKAASPPQAFMSPRPSTAPQGSLAKEPPPTSSPSDSVSGHLRGMGADQEESREVDSELSRRFSLRTGIRLHHPLAVCDLRQRTYFWENQAALCKGGGRHLCDTADGTAEWVNGKSAFDTMLADGR